MANQTKNDVSTMHPVLKAMLNKIRRCRDAYEGTDAIKDIKPVDGNAVFSTDEEYLPKLDGQNKKQYQSYKRRAVFYAAMARTVIALAGAIDRKPPMVEGADALEEFQKDVTGTGVSFDEFLSDVEREILISGRAIVCVDRKNSSDNRPYLVWYKSEDCINWFSEEYTDFNERLSSMIFQETYYEINPDNKYEQIQATQYREYSLVKGHAVVNIWRTDLQKKAEMVNIVGEGPRKEYKIVETYRLTNRGKALGFIPCVPMVSSGSAFHVPKPPLLDLVDVNLAHYRNSADLEHGLHWTALPTPYFTGLDGKDNAITIGSGSAIILSDPSSKAGFLEFSGTGLTSIEKAMKEKEGMMSALGARMLASKMDQSTSAEVTRINYSGETAALCNIAKSISRGATRLLRMVAGWENHKGFEKIEVYLNEDYVDAKLAGSDIAPLLQAYQAGAISQESLIWNLSQGERLPVGRSIEDEIELIEAGLDKESDEALFWQDSNIAFSGNNFTSGAGTAMQEENHEIQKEHADEDRKFDKDEKKKDNVVKRKDKKGDK